MIIRDSIIRLALLGTTGLAVVPNMTAADSPADNPGVDAINSVDHKSAGFREGKIIGAPIPMLTPTLGAGLAIVGGYIFKFDEKSESSFFGLGGFYTDNDSFGYGAAAKLNFMEDTWRIDFFAGDVRLNYDLGTGDSLIPLTQESPVARLGVQYSFAEDMYVGVRGTYMDNTLSRSSGTGILPPEVALVAHASIAIGELTFEADTLDDSNYPTSGHDVFVSVGYGDIVSGGSGSFNKAYTNMDYFMPLGKGVLATELTLCNADSGTPFFLQCSIGGTDHLRGFSATEFLGGSLASLQTEYRGMFSKRFGYAAFLGAGFLGDPLSSTVDEFNYSYGVGVRFRVSTAFKVDFSVDIARNNYHDNQVTVYLGQRF